MQSHNFLNKRLFRLLVIVLFSVLISIGFAGIIYDLTSIGKLNKPSIVQYNNDLLGKQQLYIDYFINNGSRERKLAESIRLLENRISGMQLKRNFSSLEDALWEIKLLREGYDDVAKILRDDINKYTKNGNRIVFNVIKNYRGFAANHGFVIDRKMNNIKGAIAAENIPAEKKRFLLNDVKNMKLISNTSRSLIGRAESLENKIFRQFNALSSISYKRNAHKTNIILVKIVLLSVLIFALFVIVILAFKTFRKQEKDNIVQTLDLAAVLSKSGISILDKALETMCDVIDADAIYIAKLNNQGFLIYKDYYAREPYRFIDPSDRKYWVAIDQYAAGQAKVERKAIIINHYEKYPQAHSEWKKAGVREFMGMPLYDESGNYFGQFSATRFSNYRFTKEDLKKFELFGQIVINLYEKDKSIKRLQDFKERIRKLATDVYRKEAASNRETIMQLILNRAEAALDADTMFFYDKTGDLLYIGNLNHPIDLDSLGKTVDTAGYAALFINMKKKEIRECEPFMFKEKNLLLLAESLKTKERCYGMLGSFYKNSEDLEIKSLSLRIVAQNVLLELINYDIIKANESLLSSIDTQLTKLLISSMEIRDSYTRGHSERVASYSEFLGRICGLGTSDVDALKTAALFHDIGKMGIPDMILLKPEKLTREEYRVIQLHPVISANLIKPVRHFESLIPIIRGHHERWDGNGYPDGLKGADIPYLARIISVADVMDAVLTTRPYRSSFSDEQTRQLIMREQGKQFDPEIAAIAIDHFDELKRYAERYENSYSKVQIAYPELDIWRDIYFYIDYRTGLLRPEGFQNGVTVFKRENRPFRLFLIDLMNLGKVNREKGVAAGDKVIKNMVDSLDEIQTKYGFRNLARHGGDSFAFIILKEDIEEEDSIEKISAEITETLKKTKIKFRLASSDFPENQHPLYDVEKEMRKMRSAAKKSA